MSKEKKYSIHSRLWITTDDGTFLGEGRVELLRQIQVFGSISKAAQEMKMSYKKAWKLVNSMNEHSAELLVTPKTGGTGGGGSELTEAGLKSIEIYSKLVEENKAFLSSKLSELSL